jgi:hypothetical protein
MLCNKYQAARYRATARTQTQWLGSKFPDYPKTTAQALKAAEEFCRRDFSAITIFLAVHELEVLTDKVRVTHDTLRQMQERKQLEGPGGEWPA